MSLLWDFYNQRVVVLYCPADLAKLFCSATTACTPLKFTLLNICKSEPVSFRYSIVNLMPFAIMIFIAPTSPSSSSTSSITLTTFLTSPLFGVLMDTIYLIHLG